MINYILRPLRRINFNCFVEQIGIYREESYFRFFKYIRVHFSLYPKRYHFNEISCTKVKFVFEQIGGKEENVIKEETKSWNETLKDIKEYGAL